MQINVIFNFYEGLVIFGDNIKKSDVKFSNITKMFNIAGILKNVYGYIESKIDLIKYDIQESIEDLMAIMLRLMVLGMFACLLILFVFFGVSIYLNHVLGSDYWGYIIVGGFFLIMILIIGLDSKNYFFKRQAKKLTDAFFTAKKNK